MSKSSEAFVGALGMKARNLGLSIETTAVARCAAKVSRTVLGSLPCSLMSPRMNGAGSGAMLP